jgi:hypothetical protein
MQEIPVVAIIAVIVGIDPIEAMHREAPTTTIDTAGTGKMIANVIAGANASDVGATEPANVTHAAADVSATEASDSAEAAADVRAAAEAAAHATCVAATTPAAASRLCLRSEQARRQQSGRQNGYCSSHRLLQSLIERCAPPNFMRHRSFR